MYCEKCDVEMILLFDRIIGCVLEEHYDCPQCHEMDVDFTVIASEELPGVDVTHLTNFRQQE